MITIELSTWAAIALGVIILAKAITDVVYLILTHRLKKIEKKR